MDDPMAAAARRSTRVAQGVLTLWRGCYDDARLIQAPWGDDEALALVHALDFGSSSNAKRDRRRRRRHRHHEDANANKYSGDDSSNNKEGSHRDDENDRRGSGDDDDNDDDDGEDDGKQGVTLNGLAIRSPLAAATGTYTAERVDDGARRPWVHLYRACVPDLPGANGRRSSAQVYVKALEAAGLDVAASASLFTGLAWTVGRGVHAPVRVVTHQNVGLDPIEFARRTLVALGAAERAVRRRAAKVVAAADAVTDAVHHEIDRLRDRLLTAYERAPTRHGHVAVPRHRDSSDERRRRRHQRRRAYDDGTERVWCASHERWERPEVSCVDASAGSSAPSHESTASQHSSSSAAASTVDQATASTEASSSPTNGTAHGHAANNTRDATTTLLPVAFDIPERSDDAYSCCSECCSSSGCSCSMETSTRDTSITGID
ncbi:hypothetical protein psal_cds_200 [Pandoravirus salinus]|uniref:Uncharacterized protein n=1 Tax=Pandoravirus salinus TaxID=1349410 RepID=S4VWA5_9VIRU|nr:hypothetical protein psal_cds_200 [Pandoravirus salinus]AGO83716.1 hypothetical protein psal_cds_200 [Pandoravirus salinus]